MTTDHHLDRQSYFYDRDELRTHWRSFIRDLLGVPEYKATADAPVLFSEKTPDNIHVASILLDLFPSARFVYIYRDGRAVVNSLRQVKKRYERKDEEPPYDMRLVPACRKWLRGQAAFDQLCAQCHAERIHSLRYERLAAPCRRNRGAYGLSGPAA